MATAKKSTTTKKSTATSSAPKKPRTPKPAVENAVEEKKETIVKADNPVKEESKKPDKVRVYIPFDPSETMEEPFMHGSVNGKFYRLRRGQEHLVTPSLAEEILRRNKTARELENFVEKKRIRD